MHDQNSQNLDNFTYHVLLLVEQPNRRHSALQSTLIVSAHTKKCEKPHSIENQRRKTYLMSPLSSVPSPGESSLAPGRRDGCGRGRLVPAAGRDPPARPTTTSLPWLVPTTKTPGPRRSPASVALLLRHPQKETARGLSSQSALLAPCVTLRDAAGARKGLAPKTAMPRAAPASPASLAGAQPSTRLQSGNDLATIEVAMVMQACVDHQRSAFATAIERDKVFCSLAPGIRTVISILPRS